MKNRFLALILSSFLSVILLGSWSTVLAQSSDNSEEEFYFNPPTPLAIAFNPELDGETYRPSGRQQSDIPFSQTERSLVGSDQRAPMLSQAFPWSTIGRLEHFVPPNGMSTCTGTLIGEDLVLTNAHCVIDNLDEDTGEIKEEIRFKLRLLENRSLATARVIEVVDIGTYSHTYEPSFSWQNPDDDWALLRIDQPLGEDFGYLGWRVLDFSDEQVLDRLPNQVRLAGYSGDFPTDRFRQFGEESQTAGVHAGCSIEGLAGDLDASPDIAPNSLVHDCDTTGGSSGSSIIALFDDGNYYIIGLHANEFGVSPNSPIFDPQEECRISRRINGERTTIEAGVPCRNGAVQVSRWATQAAETRAES